MDDEEHQDAGAPHMNGSNQPAADPDFQARFFSRSPLLIGLAACALRLVRIQTRPLWYDEAIAVLISKQGLSGVIQGTLIPSAEIAANVHPPLYFSILWVWMKVFGQSPLAVRALSVVVSLGVLGLVWRLGETLFDSRTAAAAALLYAFSPFQVHYAQEARMYMLMTLFLLAATWAMWRLLWEEWRWSHAIVLTAASALAVYTQTLSGIFLICLFLLPVLYKRWKRLGVIAVSGTAALLLYMPWFIQLPSQIGRIEAGYWIERPGVAELVQTMIAFNSGLPLTGLWLTIGLALSVFVSVMLVWRTITEVGSNSDGRRSVLAVIYMTIAPVILLYLVSQVWPVYLVRALLAAGATYLLWVAWLVANRRVRLFERVILIVVLMPLFGAGLYNFFNYQGFPYAPFMSINTYLESRLQKDGVILHSNKISMIPAYYYDQTLPHSFLADPEGSTGDTLALATQRVIGVLEETDVENAVADREQVLFVVFDRELQDYRDIGLELPPALEYLQNHYDEVSRVHYGDLQIIEFN